MISYFSHMILRIQTLYLLLAWGLFFSLFFTDMVTMISADGYEFSFNLRGFYELSDTGRTLMNTQWAIIIMGGFINLLYVAAIFLYRRRVTQSRVCIYLIVFLFGILGVLLYKVYTTQAAMQADAVHHLAMVFPVISAILTGLAFNAIRKDEMLIRAYERLRS